MKYWRNGNDLYTGEVPPIENAIEISEEEYKRIYNSRVITHLPPMDEESLD